MCLAWVAWLDYEFISAQTSLGQNHVHLFTQLYTLQKVAFPPNILGKDNQYFLVFLNLQNQESQSQTGYF
jgi:hypothetical protein